jgi:hypothetical protein
MARAVRRAGAAVRLPALAELERLAAEGALVDLPVFGPGEGQAVGLELLFGGLCLV